MMKLYSFKQQLVGLINNSRLTVEEVYYVMKDLLNEVTQNYNNQIDQYKIAAAAIAKEPEQEQEVVEDKEKEE